MQRVATSPGMLVVLAITGCLGAEDALGPGGLDEVLDVGGAAIDAAPG